MTKQVTTHYQGAVRVRAPHDWSPDAEDQAPDQPSATGEAGGDQAADTSEDTSEDTGAPARSSRRKG